ncbi:hypothetical protein [Methanofollis fontis]|uniref:Class III signal peptide-containing protein n=1 Tax=Methanofollis fontis TaxID=2052832 RepID=A0A483CZB0_9EURY|nr:hypothetical protein [Methanofollis fontis]TAJ45389.1 hypothetical protein CUJ86_01195 [Methanofollis fontis]
MARMTDEGQWIVMMGFLVAVGIFFLALVINQATLVGQTTAEGVLEFPKNDIRDFRSEVFTLAENGTGGDADLRADIIALEEVRKNAIVNYTVDSTGNYDIVTFHFNNGVTEYDETVYY